MNNNITLRWENLSLKNKLIVGSFLLGTIPSMLFGGFIYFRTINMVVETRQELIRTEFAYMEEQVNHYAQQVTKEIQYLCENEEKVLEVLAMSTCIQSIEKATAQYVVEQPMLLEEDTWKVYGDILEPILVVMATKEGEERYFSVALENSVWKEKLSELEAKYHAAVEWDAYWDVAAKRLNINLYYEVDEAVVEKDLSTIHTLFVKLFMIVITLSICFAVGVSHNFITGIRKLIQYFQKVREGELDFEVETVQKDEIGVLTESFQKMKEELSRVINQTYKLEIREKDARLKALQAQISPHFLYNALDMVNWSLIENGDFETSHIVIALSSILRYSIDDTKRYVTVKEELTQIQNYLLIQKSRFEERLSYEIEVSERLYDIPIPKLLLQPIVENAVVHGVENRHKKGLVKITAYEVDGDIIFEVTDNGQGITKEGLEKLKSKIRIDDKLVDQNQKVHIGLTNVNQRMKLTYGESYQIEIESQVDYGTAVKLQIRKGSMEDEDFSD